LGKDTINNQIIAFLRVERPSR
jgi:hypothetical protein